VAPGARAVAWVPLPAGFNAVRAAYAAAGAAAPAPVGSATPTAPWSPRWPGLTPSAFAPAGLVPEGEPGPASSSSWWWLLLAGGGLGAVVLMRRRRRAAGRV